MHCCIPLLGLYFHRHYGEFAIVFTGPSKTTCLYRGYGSDVSFFFFLELDVCPFRISFGGYAASQDASNCIESLPAVLARVSFLQTTKAGSIFFKESDFLMMCFLFQ